MADSTGTNADLDVLNIEVCDSAAYRKGADSFSDTAKRILARLPDGVLVKPFPNLIWIPVEIV